MKTTRPGPALLVVLLLTGVVAPSRRADSQDTKPSSNQPAPPTSGMKLPTAAPSPRSSAHLSGVIHNPAALVLPPVLNPPFPLYVSNNPQECAKHVPNPLFGGMICDAVLKAADTLPLMWDWQPCSASNCVGQIDGFRIYKVPKNTAYQDGNLVGLHTLVGSQTDPAFTVKGIKPFSQADCFTVRAYKGKSVSLDSPRFCANGVALGTATVAISQESGSLFENNSSCGQDPGVVKFDPYEIRVGTQHFQASCNGQYDYQGVMFFDYKGYAQSHFISKATLTLSFSGQSSCATALGAADSMDWRANNKYDWRQVQFIGYERKIDLLPAQGGKVVVDMTDWVRSSVGSANGFTLITKNDCLSSYNASLAVTYFK